MWLWLSFNESGNLTVTIIFTMTLITVDMQKFAGLDFHGFNPTEVFAEMLSCFLSQKCLLRKSGAYIHGKNFHGTLENCENLESLTQ